MLYHITTQSEWDSAKQTGVYRTSSLDSAGFIHLSATVDQVERVANALYQAVDDVIVLHIDKDALKAPVKMEPPDATVPAEHYDGELFPHLYGELPASAVIDATRLNKNNDGQYESTIR